MSAPRIAAVETQLAAHSIRLDALEDAIPRDHLETPRRRAVAFLRSKLKDSPRPAFDLIRDAIEAGFSERTLRRAAKALGVSSYRGKGPAADPRRAYWRLPVRRDMKH
jgi:hypothetical protein